MAEDSGTAAPDPRVEALTRYIDGDLGFAAMSPRIRAEELRVSAGMLAHVDAADRAAAYMRVKADTVSTGERLAALIARCKCSVTVSVNPHRDYYETPADYLRSRSEAVDPGLLAEMTQTNTLIELQFYPDTPVGFIVLFGLDLDALLDEALNSFAGRE